MDRCVYDKLFYLLFYCISVFLLLNFTNPSLAGTSNDGRVISGIAECKVETRDVTNNSLNYCEVWEYIFDDNTMINSSTIKGTINCKKWVVADKNTSQDHIYDNVGWTSKFSVYHKDYSHSTYTCRDGSVKSTNSCNVKYVAQVQSCTCGFCAARITSKKNGWWACYGTKRKRYNNRGSECSVAWHLAFDSYGCGDCSYDGGERQYYCLNYGYDTSSTETRYYNEYYTYHITTCFSPTLKTDVKLGKLYDPNLISN